MRTLGIDAGSLNIKFVILDNGGVVASGIGPSGDQAEAAARQAIARATGGSFDPAQYAIAATGAGARSITFSKQTKSVTTCLARGFRRLLPEVRTGIDMGGQDCKAISVDGNGVVTNFVMNDKCAGGTGRFLEMIAEVLGLPLTAIGEAALTSKNAIPFNTICAVFAKSEALAYLRKGVARSDILAGLHEAISVRCLNLLKRVTIQKDFAITGGIAKNRGMVAKIREKVGIEPMLCPDPQLAGALGAAIFAEQRRPAAGATGKVQYGYSDGTGSYFITLDYGLCDGCGDCAGVCPRKIFVMQRKGADRMAPVVSETARKKLALLCPGLKTCGGKNQTCQQACSKKAIGHSW